MKKQLNLPALSRKLSLSKRTISNLNSSQMKGIVGGGPSAWCGQHTKNCDGGNSKNCTKNQNTCPGHATCYC